MKTGIYRKVGAPFNRLILFKALVIQSLYNLSDDQLEYQIIYRASFKRFLELKKSDKVPDIKTFWMFREQLIEKNIIMGLFKTFNETLDAAGVFANEGKMVDARWTKINSTAFYGYINHIKADAKTKLTEKNIVTDASVQDCLRCYFVVTSYGKVT